MNSRLDLLIYAHDGRGLGHVSRSVAVCLAFKRLFPEKTVLLVTGCAKTRELTQEGLDWLKLPSYATNVSDGVSAGIIGLSGFGDADLGLLRSNMIRDIVKNFRPRVVLADHTPQGKHRELVSALSISKETDTKWILGVRAVVGDVGKVWSEMAADLFSRFYSGLIWYGDQKVSGLEELDRLRIHFGCDPFLAGYVSRLKEFFCSGSGDLVPCNKISKNLDGVVSVPWTFGDSSDALRSMVSAISCLGRGKWSLYLGGCSKVEREKLAESFSSGVSLEMNNVGRDFLVDLFRAELSIIYGGYNSLTDVMAAKIPSVVMLRGMKDGEQEKHVHMLSKVCPYIVDVIEHDKIDSDRVLKALLKCRELRAENESSGVDLDGASRAAKYIYSFLGEN